MQTSQEVGDGGFDSSPPISAAGWGGRGILAFFVKDLLMVGVWVYLWALYFVPLIHMSVFVPVSCCFDYCSSVVLSEVWEGYASSFSLFHQYCFGDSGSFIVPYKLEHYLF